MSVVLILCMLTVPSAVFSADPGGGGGDTGEGKVTTWVVLGLAVGLGILFTLDILADSGSAEPDSSSLRDPEVSQLVDWDVVGPPERAGESGETPSMAVVSFAVRDGYDLASDFLEALRTASPTLFDYYPEPLEFGDVGPAEAADMASNYYGCELVVHGSPLESVPGGLVLALVSPGGSAIWTDTLQGASPESLGLSASRLIRARSR